MYATKIDNTKTAPVAPLATETPMLGTVATAAPNLAAVIEESSNPMLRLCANIIDAFALVPAAARDASETALDNLPALAPPAESWEACAAFGMAIFGSKLVRSVDDKNGSRIETAFQIAAAYLHIKDGDPAASALEAMAVVAYSYAKTE